MADTLYSHLRETFITDCIENKGYTKAEAKRLFHQKGDKFLESMIEDLWTNWSENFPVEDKGK